MAIITTTVHHVGQTCERNKTMNWTIVLEVLVEAQRLLEEIRTQLENLKGELKGDIDELGND